MIINGRKIGSDSRPYIVAELSANHNGSLEHALDIVEAAAKSGVDAVKLQTYTPDTMTIDLDTNEFRITDKNSLWYGRSLYELYEDAQTPWEWHKEIIDKCKEHNIAAFSTPFDVTAVDFLEYLDVPCYKIASFENIDLSLIKRVSETGKPLIISTGMASVGEIAEAVETARESGCKDIVLLKATSTYPATPEDTNISTLPHMRQLFGCEVGLSDHTMGLGVAVASVALGAVMIEKHFTLSRREGGVDAAFSAEPHELRELVVETERAWQSLGRVEYGPVGKEIKSLVFRRSLYIVKDVNKGETLTEENVRAIRPGNGLAPKYFNHVIGKRVNRPVKRGTALNWEIIG